MVLSIGLSVLGNIVLCEDAGTASAGALGKKWVSQLVGNVADLFSLATSADLQSLHTLDCSLLLCNPKKS